MVNDHADPAGIDAVAKATLDALPLQVGATPEEAKQFVAQLGANVGKIKAEHEPMLRKLYGDAVYERSYKQDVDRTFAQAEGAETRKPTERRVRAASKLLFG